MNRRGFLRALAGAGAAAVAAPLVMLEGPAVAAAPAAAAVATLDEGLSFYYPLDDVADGGWTIEAWADQHGNVYTGRTRFYDQSGKGA